MFFLKLKYVKMVNVIRIKSTKHFKMVLNDAHSLFKGKGKNDPWISNFN